MGLKSEALALVRFLEGKIKALPTAKQSEWVAQSDAAKATGIDESELQRVLRRPRVKNLLAKAGIGCSYRTQFLYVYKTANFGQTTLADSDADDLDKDDENAPAGAAPAQPKDDWSLDPNYFWMPPEADDVNIAIDAGMNVFVVGPAGSGKSSMLIRLCEKRGVKPIVVSFHGEVSVDDIVGVKDLVSGATVFTEGVLPTAMRKGVPLIIDEADSAPPDVQFVFHSVLMRQPLCLTKKGSEFVNPEPGFCVLATGNTIGRGDDSGMWAGTHVQNEAYLDRYGAVVELWYMPKEEEVKVLVKRTGVHKRTAEKMIEVATGARDALKADRLASTFSTRKLLDWASLVTHSMDLGRAFRRSCLAKIGPEDKKVLVEVAHAVFGSALGIDPNSI